MFVVRIIYLVQRLLAKRREQQYRAEVSEHYPDIGDEMQANGEFIKGMNAMSADNKTRG